MIRVIITGKILCYNETLCVNWLAKSHASILVQDYVIVLFFSLESCVDRMILSFEFGECVEGGKTCSIFCLLHLRGKNVSIKLILFSLEVSRVDKRL